MKILPEGEAVVGGSREHVTLLEEKIELINEGGLQKPFSPE